MIKLTIDKSNKGLAQFQESKNEREIFIIALFLRIHYYYSMAFFAENLTYSILQM